MRNALAQMNMRAMRRGELGFFYHSVKEKRIVGAVKIVREIHPNSTDATGRWNCVDVSAAGAFPRPVTLAEIKAEPRLANMALVKNSRLSVQPVTAEEWALVCRMGGYEQQG